MEHNSRLRQDRQTRPASSRVSPSQSLPQTLCLQDAPPSRVTVKPQQSTIVSQTLPRRDGGAGILPRKLDLRQP